ncbi:Putative acyltransferase [Sinobacterium norvegicum]|uniref:Acyltransferase n=1 Tax=Sinobacterium norvegicum TaxID=1641715 RepID=A0ABM9AD27_9GAMM|nr:acetyl-CoA C-acyltransferase [Sinobacterium norvegicum]CAH0991099.1 Putative acyltransferase [Sinobacterium norvegicum]
MPKAMIVDAVRIPRAVSSSDGAYAHLSPVDLLAPLYQALEQRNGFDSAEVEDVLLGCATQTGAQGANLGKISSLYAGWSNSVSGTTVNRFCCSGLDAINLAASKIIAGMESLVVAGGVEQLSRVPMFADKGAWYSEPKVMRATRFIHMGVAADVIASQQNYSREQLDQLSLQSQQRAEHARQQGYFSPSVIPVLDSHGRAIITDDNAIRPKTTVESLGSLPASFSDFIEPSKALVKDVYPYAPLQALHSAGNSPALVDGASLVLLASEQRCQQLGLTPRASVRHFANASDEPVKMLTGHLRATEKLLRACELGADDIDLWEVNESFAASVLNYQQHFAIDGQKLNVNGSAIALGHPLGATGGNLLATLLDELERRDLKRGVIAICGGAGVGVATLIERL